MYVIFQVTESGKQERHLVAAVGKFSVIWNFQQVKDSAHRCYQNQQGLKSCYCYKIVPKDESVVESRFMHDKYAVSDSPEAPLVVATPMKVTSISMSGKKRGLGTSWLVIWSMRARKTFYCVCREVRLHFFLSFRFLYCLIASLFVCALFKPHTISTSGILMTCKILYQKMFGWRSVCISIQVTWFSVDI